jgi:putative transposase
MMVGGLAPGSPTMVDFNASHFEREIVVAVRWYVAYPISHHQLEAMMEERDVKVGHSSHNRWVIRYVPLLDQALPCSETSWRWRWRLANGRTLCADQRPVEAFVPGRRQERGTVDFLPTAKRDRKAALHFLCKAVGQHGTPAKITVDGSGAKSVAIEDYNEEHDAEVEIQQVKYLNNVIEQDHRAIKR